MFLMADKKNLLLSAIGFYVSFYKNQHLKGTQIGQFFHHESDMNFTIHYTTKKMTVFIKILKPSNNGGVISCIAHV